MKNRTDDKYLEPKGLGKNYNSCDYSHHLYRESQRDIQIQRSYQISLWNYYLKKPTELQSKPTDGKINSVSTW